MLKVNDNTLLLYGTVCPPFRRKYQVNLSTDRLWENLNPSPCFFMFSRQSESNEDHRVKTSNLGGNLGITFEKYTRNLVIDWRRPQSGIISGNSGRTGVASFLAV